MQKQRDDIKPFTFSEISGKHVVSGNGGFQAFSFQDLNGETVKARNASEEEIRSERNFAAKNDFKIDELVKDYRGLSRQEQTDLEKKIQTEVNKRVEAAYQQAYAEGLAKGEAKGREEALTKHTQDLAGNVDHFIQLVQGLQDQTAVYMESHRAEVYEFIKRFTKWIVMKEINEKVYLEQLLEKLILELNSRKNLIIKVGRAQFESMPDVVKTVESRLGQLQNTRIEIVPELRHPGIVLEGENGLIDGSLEGVFANIDKVFGQVLGHE
jgi:flagellar assembly protein FliH